jgi:hypothetical protein
MVSVVPGFCRFRVDRIGCCNSRFGCGVGGSRSLGVVEARGVLGDRVRGRGQGHRRRESSWCLKPYLDEDSIRFQPLIASCFFL